MRQPASLYMAKYLFSLSFKTSINSIAQKKLAKQKKRNFMTTSPTTKTDSK